MSIKIMSMVWDIGPEKQADRFVLLAIADYANDDGECWPSIAGICRKTCMSERGVQGVIRRLEASGWLSVSVGLGRRNCNVYTVKNPAPPAPRTSCPPHMDAETPHMDAINPAPPAPEPSLTIKEPSNISNRPCDSVASILCGIDGIHPKAVDSFIAYRKKHKSKALTETAANRLAANLWQIIDAGGDPTDALGMAEERGWATIQPDWYFNAKGKQNDPRNSGGASQSGASRAGRGPHHDMVAAFAQVAAQRSGRA